eukprot:TRINITY_DN26582_c0_g1_i1.p1 TRINITY_DN26582_c0_g1~~TRINITY_DN26582_c0_g1_i1.p1  ORF type:complete len:154 (-),score=67.84 TRINITY_DN26582_c0_g1_i1:232-693(-)
MENLAGFMFGNVDSSGNLESDSSVFGSTECTPSVLRGLSSLLSSKELLSDVLSKESSGAGSEVSTTTPPEDSGELLQKAEDAQDYADITEALSDDSDESSCSSEGPPETAAIKAEIKEEGGVGDESRQDMEENEERTSRTKEGSAESALTRSF